MEPLIARGLRGVGANAVGHAISAANSIILVPVFLASWGSQSYGEWLALSAAIGYLTLLDFGIQTYVVNRMCQAYAQGRLDDLHRDLHSSLRVFLAVAVIGLAGLLAFVVLAPLDAIFNLRVTSQGTAALTFLLLGVNVLLNAIPMGLVGGLYRATGAYPRGQMMGNAFRLLQLAVTVTVASLRLSMAVLALSWVFVNAVVITVILLDLRRFRPEVSVSLRLGSIQHGMSLMGPALLFLLIGLAAAASLQGTVLIINWFLGGVAVVQFTTTRTMANVIPQSMSVVSSAFWPELTAIEAYGEKGRLARLSQSLVKVNVSFAVVTGLLLHFVGPDLYQLWTGRQVSFELVLLDIMLAQVVLMAFWNTCGLPLMATNRQGAYACWMLVNALVTLAFAAVLVRPWGTVGVAFGSLAADVMCSLFVVPWLSGRFLGESLRFLFVTSFVRPLVIGSSLFALLAILQPLIGSPIWRLLGVPTLIVMLFGTATYLFSLNASERDVVRGFRQRMLASSLLKGRL